MRTTIDEILPGEVLEVLRDAARAVAGNDSAVEIIQWALKCVAHDQYQFVPMCTIN